MIKPLRSLDLLLPSRFYRLSDWCQQSISKIVQNEKQRERARERERERERERDEAKDSFRDEGEKQKARRLHS